VYQYIGFLKMTGSMLLKKKHNKKIIAKVQMFMYGLMFQCKKS